MLARSMNGKQINFDTDITAETDVIRDLRLDSLAAMDFIMALETRFDTLIPVDNMVEVRTVGDLAELLRLHAARTAAA